MRTVEGNSSDGGGHVSPEKSCTQASEIQNEEVGKKFFVNVHIFAVALALAYRRGLR